MRLKNETKQDFKWDIGDLYRQSPIFSSVTKKLF